MFRPSLDLVGEREGAVGVGDGEWALKVGWDVGGDVPALGVGVEGEALVGVAGLG